MGERPIMESFNLDNSYKQKLRFLEQKYASLLLGRTDKWKENFLKKVNDALSDEDKVKISEKSYELKKDDETVDTINDILYYLKEEGLLGVLSKIADVDILKNIVSMLAKSGKNISDKKSLDEFNTIMINSLLVDLEEYRKIRRSMEELESETTSGHKNSQLFGYISKNISGSLKDVLEKGEGFLDEEKSDVAVKLPNVTAHYDEDGNLIEEEISTGNDEILGEELKDAIRKNFVNPIAFFHAVQRIYQKYNYVITAKEIGHLKTIFSDIKKGRMVFLTGDTGSGKTELCLLISQLYLDEVWGEGKEREKKEPVIVTGNSETDFSDFTMEKIVTSENYLSSSDDALNREETTDVKLKEFIEKMNKSQEFKEALKDVTRADTSLDRDEIEKRCEEIDKKDLLEYDIFTKYHLQGMIKAMKEGVPLIIDEMNGIRPEVLLGLNHYFTRKVGQTVSLGNGFSPVEIKKGFCIMCTGNDKDENTNAKRYRGRYTIDESLMNRMHRICKGYHEQEIKGFTNVNSGGFGENKEMLDYMTSNELYGVILMLFFSKKGNKKVNKLENDEFNRNTATDLLTHTEVTAFDVVKEEFVGMDSVEQKKKNFFQNLMKLASFIKLLQLAFQGKPVMCKGSVDAKPFMENSQGFSMRDLLTIINSYKSDTKSLWYHLYHDYIKQIPVDNKARIGAYLIAREAGFLDNDLNIDANSVDTITKNIERNLQKEKQTSGKSTDFELMDVHNKRVEVNELLLTQGRLIITKQDMYKEYFGDKFSDGIEISDEEVDKYEEELAAQGAADLAEEEENYSVDTVVSICEAILSQENDATYEKFFKAIDFGNLMILKHFCVEHAQEENVEKYNQETINELGKILTIIENFITKDSFLKEYEDDEEAYKLKANSLVTQLKSGG